MRARAWLAGGRSPCGLMAVLEPVGGQHFGGAFLPLHPLPSLGGFVHPAAQPLSCPPPEPVVGRTAAPAVVAAVTARGRLGRANCLTEDSLGVEKALGLGRREGARPPLHTALPAPAGGDQCWGGFLEFPGSCRPQPAIPLVFLPRSFPHTPPDNRTNVRSTYSSFP